MRQPPKKKRKEKSLLAEEYEYVEDYGLLVRGARERMGLSQDELASLVKEKATIIKKIEQGEFHPPIELARRLEKVLKIRIVQEAVEERLTELPKPTKHVSGLTLGDILKKQEEQPER